MVSQLLIYQRVRLCANLPWFDLDMTSQSGASSATSEVPFYRPISSARSSSSSPHPCDNPAR
jgi:hypothetical protein